MQARFGIIEIPRSMASAMSNARLAEEVGFDWVGVADSQSPNVADLVLLGHFRAAAVNYLSDNHAAARSGGR